jgi:hypothetical protein
VEKSHGEVKRFWAAIEQSFLPALAKADTAAAAKSYAEITAAYSAHRAVIDEIVKQTNDDNAAAEADATARDKFFTRILWITSAFVFFVVCAGIAGVAKGVIQPIIKMTEVMKRLAGGELASEIPRWVARTRSAPWLARCKSSRKTPCVFGRWKPNKPSPPGKPRRTEKLRCWRWPKVSRRPLEMSLGWSPLPPRKSKLQPAA